MIFFVIFVGLVIILFQTLLLGHWIIKDESSCLRRNYPCYLWGTMPHHWLPDFVFCWPVLLTGNHVMSLVTRQFTACATDLRRCFLSSDIFYLTFLSASFYYGSSGAGRSKLKSAGLHAKVQNTVLAWLFLWITQQSTNLIFSNELYLNMANIFINYLQWGVKL